MVFAHVVDRDDVRVDQLSRGLGFRKEPFLQLLNLLSS